MLGSWILGEQPSYHHLRTVLDVMGFQVWKKLALNGSKRGRRVYTSCFVVAKMEIPGRMTRYTVPKSESGPLLRSRFALLLPMLTPPPFFVFLPPFPLPMRP